MTTAKKKRKMKAGAGSRKGGAFERWTGKQLSLWLTGGEDDTQLIRSALSGGWEQGKSGQASWRHLGDLCPNGQVADRFRQRFVVECKHQASVDLWDLWTVEKAKLLKWWHQVCAEVMNAGVPGLQPMLIFRANRLPTMVVMSTTLLPVELHNVRRVATFGWHGGLALFPFEELLECSPDRFLADITADA